MTFVAKSFLAVLLMSVFVRVQAARHPPWDDSYPQIYERESGPTYETEFDDIWIEIYACAEQRVVVPHYAPDGPTVRWQRKLMSSEEYEPIELSDEMPADHGFWLNGTDLVIEQADLLDSGLYRATENSSAVRMITYLMPCTDVCDTAENKANCMMACIETCDFTGQLHIEAMRRERCEQELLTRQLNDPAGCPHHAKKEL